MSTLAHTLRALLCAFCLVVPSTALSLAQGVTRIPDPILTPMQEGPNVPLNGFIKSHPAQTPLVSIQLTLKAGESRRINGRLSLTSTSNGTAFTAAWVSCFGPGWIETERGTTNQNYAGKNTAAGSISGYPLPGVLALYPSYLLQTNVGATFTCGLFGSTDSNDISVMPEDEDGFPITYLLTSSTDDTGAMWWQNLNCSGTGEVIPYQQDNYSMCKYLGGPIGTPDIYEFFNQDGSPAKTWTAPDNAAFVSAQDSLLVTTCYYGTRSCIPEERLDEFDAAFDNQGGTYVQSHLELNQLDSFGNVCKTSQSPDQISFVDNTSHHFEIYHLLQDVPVYAECGSRTFQLRMYIKYLSGNPLKIDGSDTLSGSNSMTHAFAWASATSPNGNSYEVPNLFGLNQDQATGLITGSDYNVAAINSATSTAPVGTVIGQTPAPGLIEFPGTGVSFTVSSGGVSIPSLIDQNGVAARNEILALGLVPAVSYDKACIAPGDVLTQNIPAGTVVPIGTGLSITIDSGTWKTCVVK